MKKIDILSNMKTFRTTVVVIILFVLSSGILMAQTTVTIYSSADNEIYEAQPTKNWGVSNTMYVIQGTGNRDRCLVLFDMSGIPSTATIISATMTLVRKGGTSNTAVTIGAHQITNSWAEGTGDGAAMASNWNQRQTGTNWTTAGGDFNATSVVTTSVTSNGSYTWSIPTMVQDWVTTPGTNYGVLLKSTNEAGSNEEKFFATREDKTPANRPKLVIVYTATYYSKGSLFVGTASNWNSARDGSGTDASSFDTGHTWVIQNGHSMTLSGSSILDVSATGTVQIESGGSWSNSSNGAVTMGTFKVDNGGTYILSESATIPGTTRTFGSNSTIDYAGADQSIAALTYGNLTLSGSGTKTFADGTTGIAGALNINGSATPQTLGGTCTINYNGSGDQIVKAMSYNNLTLSNAGTKIFSGVTMIDSKFDISEDVLADARTNSTIISYSGGSTQFIQPIDYYRLTLTNSGVKVFSSDTTRVVLLVVNSAASADAITNKSTIEYNGSFSQTIKAMNYYNLILSGSGTKYFPAGTTGIAGKLSVTDGASINTVNNNSVIDYNGAANQTVSAIDYYDLTLSNSGTKYFGAGTVGIGGNLELKDLAEVDAITYNDTVKYYLINKTVRYGFINKNVSVSSQTSVTSMTNIPVTGSLIISPEATLDMNGYVLTVGEKLINNGTYVSTNPAGSLSFYSKNSGDFNSLDSWSNNSYSGEAAVRLPGTVNNDVLIIGDNKTINLTSSISNLGTVRVDSSGTLNPDSYIISGSGEFDLRKGGTLKITSPTGIDSASGNIQTATQLYDASANFEFSGSSPQVTGTEFPSSASNLIINNPSGVALSNSTRLSSDLLITQGRLILGENNLTLGSTSSIIGTPSSTNMIIASGTGQLRKEFTSAGSFTFPVGDDSGSIEYSPITLNFTSGTFSSAYAGVKVVNTKHPQDSSTSHFINRYWTVNSNGITDFSCDVTCNYSDEDIQPGANETKIYARQFNGSQWTLLNPVNASMNELSGTVSSFGDFSGGENNATTGIKITSDHSPTSFALSQNYPNPFNPSTKIRYAIPLLGGGFVILKVYDILGNEVVTLVNEEQAAGFYEVNFDGAQLSSGVYIYKVQVYSANGGAGNFSDTRKMLLTK